MIPEREPPVLGQVALVLCIFAWILSLEGLLEAIVHGQFLLIVTCVFLALALGTLTYFWGRALLLK